MINYFMHSPIAQLVEHSAVNRVVTGSSPVRGAIFFLVGLGEIPKWLKGTLCYGVRLRKRCEGSNPSLSAISLRMCRPRADFFVSGTRCAWIARNKVTNETRNWWALKLEYLRLGRCSGPKMDAVTGVSPVRRAQVAENGRCNRRISG